MRVLKESEPWVDPRGSLEDLLVPTGFQRQLLLFARMGCAWFPILDGVWRTVEERRLAEFRALAEHLATEMVCANPEFPSGSTWRAIVFIHDLAVRDWKQWAELRFDLGAEARRCDAMQRLRTCIAFAIPFLLMAQQAGMPLRMPERWAQLALATCDIHVW